MVTHRRACANVESMEEQEHLTPAPAGALQPALMASKDSPSLPADDEAWQTYRGVRVASNAMRRAAQRSSIAQRRSVKQSTFHLFFVSNLV